MMQSKGDYCDSPTINSDGCSNLVDCLLYSIKTFKDNIAQIDYNGNQKITFNQIRTKTFLAGYWLSNAGIKYGDVVGICSPNNVNYIWQILAILNTGASCALIPPTLTPRELIHNLSITKPKAIIGQYINNEQLQIFLDTECIQYVWLENETTASKCKSLTELVKDYGENMNLVKNCQYTGLCPAEGKDPSFILTSSGSTGLPKGVVLTHNNLIAMLSCKDLFMKPNGTAVGLMPFCHAFGLGLMLMALHEGTKMVILPKFSLNTFLNVITTHKVTHLHIVPSLMTTLAKSADVNSETLSSIQAVYTGAGPVITKHQRALINKLPSSAKLYHTYGMTETTFVVMFGECRSDKPGSAGKLLPGFSTKIISERGEELEGQIGELYVKGNTIMLGYKDNPEVTSQTIDKYRWLHTGDLAYYDSDGYYYIVDRIKEMIKYQGFQISPTELELVLLTHVGVSEAAVIGIPHEIYGEVPKAFVVRNNKEQPVTEEELQNLIKNELSTYKQLRGGVTFVDSLPNSPSGKIQRKYLKSLNKKN